MSAAFLCPACEVALLADACPRCGPRLDARGLLDLRLDRSRDDAPAPLARGALDARLAGARPGPEAFRERLEQLLLALSDDGADRLMQLLRESRGAWFPMLRSRGGTALFLGSSLSGAVTSLAGAGFEVLSLELSAERARFAALRDASHSPGRARAALGGDGPRLPFADRAFDVVVCEDAFSGRANRYGFELGECRRVAGEELVLIDENRLAYKRSSGRRGDFRVPGPIAFARRAAFPAPGERTLAGHRRALEGRGYARAKAYALYPHLADFSHVVAIDERAPALTIGPMERKNRLKLAGRALGLFPVFAPTFALVAAREEAARAPRRIERLLAAIAERVGEPVPEVDVLVATRGNTAVIHTRLAGAGEDEPAGRWTLHVPLAPKNGPQVERHVRFLRLLRERFPRVPVPEPLLCERVDGVLASVERRARGWTAPQKSGDRPLIARMLADAARDLALLVTRPAAPLAPEGFDALLGARFDVVARHANVASTVARLARMRDEARERLVGARLPRVVEHSDLRAKHVQIDRDGSAIAYLDWGTAEEEGLPYHDLLHLVVHQRKQEEGRTPGDAWRAVAGREGLREEERAALEGYRAAVGLDAETARAIEAIYPVLVGAMAETHWDYSRPRWLHRQFAL